jgi:hypothetical protein
MTDHNVGQSNPIRVAFYAIFMATSSQIPEVEDSRCPLSIRADFCNP